MKVEILTPLKTEMLGNRLWVLTDPFKIMVDGALHEIPRGFVYDGNSAPRGLWSLCAPAGGVYGQAAIPHDWFYSLDNPNVIPRLEADKIHKAVGKLRGAGIIRSNLVYSGIRSGGGFSFRKKHSLEKLTNKTCFDYKYAIKRVKQLKKGMHL